MASPWQQQNELQQGAAQWAPHLELQQQQQLAQSLPWSMAGNGHMQLHTGSTGLAATDSQQQDMHHSSQPAFVQRVDPFAGMDASQSNKLLAQQYQHLLAAQFEKYASHHSVTRVVYGGRHLTNAQIAAQPAQTLPVPVAFWGMHAASPQGLPAPAPSAPFWHLQGPAAPRAANRMSILDEPQTASALLLRRVAPHSEGRHAKQLDLAAASRAALSMLTDRTAAARWKRGSPSQDRLAMPPPQPRQPSHPRQPSVHDFAGLQAYCSPVQSASRHHPQAGEERGRPPHENHLASQLQAAPDTSDTSMTDAALPDALDLAARRDNLRMRINQHESTSCAEHQEPQPAEIVHKPLADAGDHVTAADGPAADRIMDAAAKVPRTADGPSESAEYAEGKPGHRCAAGSTDASARNLITSARSSSPEAAAKVVQSQTLSMGQNQQGRDCTAEMHTHSGEQADLPGMRHEDHARSPLRADGHESPAVSAHSGLQEGTGEPSTPRNGVRTDAPPGWLTPAQAIAAGLSGTTRMRTRSHRSASPVAAEAAAAAPPREHAGEPCTELCALAAGRSKRVPGGDPLHVRGP